MKIEGTWEKNVMVKGKWILPNGIYFEGNFLNNKPNGLGTWHFLDGNTCDGVYTQKENEEAEEEEPVLFLSLN
jgi:radial spoke head protein 1